MEAIASFFKFGERGTTFGTEVRAGVTTFMVMAYIIFVNPNIIAAPLQLDRTAVAAGTALIAGVMTIAMGVIGKYPIAIAAGLGLNAIVAFGLTAQGLDARGAMGVVLLEGIVILVLVLVGFREAVMNAVPLALKRAIAVGIGLFILFIGFFDGGLINSPTCFALPCPAPGVPPVEMKFPNSPPQFVFLIGLLITFGLYVLRIRGALIISIVLTAVIAFVAGATQLPATFALTPNFSTLGLGLQDPFQVFTRLPLLVAILTIFAIMLADFFDTMGTVTGIAAEAGLARPDGTVPGVGRVLAVDSVAAIAGGAGGVSSNTSYIESAAGVAEGGRTGFTSIVTGVLFLVAILLAPLTQLIPIFVTAPALVLVGYLMFTLIRDIPLGDVEEGLPALLTMILMPLTFNITVGIGAGFISWVFIKVVRRKFGEIHWLMWIVAIAFIVYFLTTFIQGIVNPVPPAPAA
jgi:AGZA family xanthine/uracil permease-like MFS transporter